MMADTNMENKQNSGLSEQASGLVSQPTQKASSDKLKVVADFLPRVNYALLHNGVRVLNYCDIENCSGEDLRHVFVSVEGDMLKGCETAVELIPRGQTVHVGGLQLVPDIDALLQLTEAVSTSFTLRISQPGATDDEKVILYEASYPITLLTFDEWPGTSIMPTVLTSFVTPNDATVSALLTEAAALLDKMTGSSALDEYQTRDPNRVRAMVAAVYKAIQGRGIIYSNPPASFQSTGQRIRLPEKVLSEKLATCMDSALLMASCLEAMGVHPLLVMMKGHIMVGAWLVDRICANALSDDSTFLLKGSADGINEIVLVESTCVTSDTTFERAVNQAESKLRGGEDDFQFFLDVSRSRMDGIRPLPQRVMGDGHWTVVNTGLEHRVANEKLAEKERFEVEVEQGVKLTKQQLWERKLLDISLRNNLTNLRIGKRVLPFISFAIEKLEDQIQAHEDYSILPKPDSVKVEPNEWGIYDSSNFKNQYENMVLEGTKHNQLYSYYTEAELKQTLKFLYRTSRTVLEENGANSLFLTLGLLKWYETPKSVRPRYAPILMMPVDIIRKSGENYIIRSRDEDIILNITMLEMLKQQFKINLSSLDPLPTDESGVDVKKILTIVRTHIMEQARWDVIEEAMLGIFSFNKFVMWNDIHNNADKLRDNKIVASLLDQRVAWKEEDSGTDARAIDRNEQPATFAAPLDVDSSQLEAVVESGEGKSFILHGPPGTGKSQTITNMIANALYHGKRVLFVAEKMAALSVVQKRLTKIGLEPFCLEMHSNKATKTHFLQQLNMALEVAHIKSSEQYAETSKQLFEQRKQLIDYMEALHRKHSSGLSLYDCITQYLSIEGDELRLPLAQINEINGQTLLQQGDEIASLDTVFQVTGQPSQHPLKGLDIYDASLVAMEKIDNGLRQMTSVVGKAARWPSFFDKAEWPEKAALLKQAEEVEKTVTGEYDKSVLSEDVNAMKARWAEVQDKWFLPRFFAKRKLMKELRLFRKDMTADQIDPLIGQLENRNALLDQCKDLLAPLGADQEQAATTAKQLAGMIDQLKELCHFDPSNMTAVNAQLPTWIAHLDEARTWTQWSVRKRKLEQQKLQPVVSYIENQGKTGGEASDALLKGVYHQLALKNIDADKTLQMFNGLIFEDMIDKYRQLAAQFQELTKKELYCRLAAAIPNMTIEAANTSEVGILKRNIKNNGRATSIRQIIDQIPTLLPKLCPCMLMSPISVAQYIDLNNDKFDLVIFDEASQMPTSESIGAIARGKALVVVGDPMQMPPTSFFKTSATDEEDADIEDMESILDDCITLSIPSRYLSWHYRSKHESLIAFSNANYYDSRLTTFPSVDDRVSKVQLVHVDGVYDKSHSRCNRAEAEAIVDEVVRRLSDPKLSERSIGIVSFSLVQQNLIEDILIDTLAKQPKLEEKAFHSAEPIFIKNLENVQGDERDVILFSVGYGPDKNGNVSMNFGPLNNSGGERRLNVAVSRARYEMMIFSTLRPEQIDLNRSKARGVEGLKRFLEFAQNGRLPLNATTTSANPMEKEKERSTVATQLAEILRRNGYTVDMNVGRSHFKVDLAVLDPTDDGRYLLGILCDGPSYYETKTARDREITQPSVLNMLNWNIMRLWSVDWFENRQKVTERIMAKLKELEKAKPEDKNPEPLNIQPLKFFNVADEPVENPAEGITEEYKFTTLNVPAHSGDISYLLSHDSQVKKHVERIISTEQPITLSLLINHISKVWEVGRTAKLKDKVAELALSVAFFDSNQAGDNPCYWMDRKLSESYKKFRTDSGRDAADIPVIEVMNAVSYAMRQQVAVPFDDLKRQVAQLFGFTRRTPKTDAMVEEAAGKLIKKSVIEKKDDTLVLKS
ncbi:MAG: DUF4011 domain-containing protein [Prevotella sp.]|nr:DUF4011 domain-containing protein [Prevotella sp.]